jgi:hypothetical protein
MRTTVTLEPDVAARLKEYAHRRRTSFKAALNAAVRRGLSAQEPTASSRRRFVVKPHSSPFRPGIDSGKLNQLVDQLEAENYRRARRTGR